MRLLRFDGVIGYENNNHITKGDNNEPILMKDCDNYEYREETEIYIGSHEELEKIWQSLIKNETQYSEPNFIKGVDYCIIMADKNQPGEYYPVIPKVCKVSEVDWDYYKNITSWKQITEDSDKLFMEWLKLHSIWKENRKEVN